MNQETKNLQDLFDQYIDECRYAKRLRKATIKGYREVFSNFIKSVPEIKTTDHLIPQLVTKFFIQQGEKGTSNSTVYTYYNKLIIFFRWLEDSGYIEKGSLSQRVAKPLRPEYHDSKALKTEEIGRIQSAIVRLRMDEPFLLKRDNLILAILLYTGVRKGELLGIRISDIDWTYKHIHINGATSKSKKGRNIPINPMLQMHLKIYLEELRLHRITSPFLILSRRLTKFTEHGMKHWVEKYKECSGVSFHLHQFRHTFATTLARARADISSIKALMGHSSVSMTERYLRSITPESARNHIDNLSF